MLEFQRRFFRSELPGHRLVRRLPAAPDTPSEPSPPPPPPPGRSPADRLLSLLPLLAGEARRTTWPGRLSGCTWRQRRRRLFIHSMLLSFCIIIFFCAVFLPHCWALKLNQLKCCVQFARFIAAFCTWSVKGFMFQASWGCSVECEEPLYWATGRTFKWSSQLRGDSLSGEAEGSTELSYLPFAKWTCQY